MMYLVLSLVVMFGFCVVWIVFHYVVRLVSQRGEVGRWESYPVVEDGQVIGYRVRWSTAYTDGRYLWVGHYFAGEDTSIEWCQIAALRHAERLNNDKKMPWEFREFVSPTL